MERKFKECRECAEKPGMPYLCTSCLENRETIRLLRCRVDQSLERAANLLESMMRQCGGVMLTQEVLEACDAIRALKKEPQK